MPSQGPSSEPPRPTDQRAQRRDVQGSKAGLRGGYRLASIYPQDVHHERVMDPHRPLTHSQTHSVTGGRRGTRRPAKDSEERRQAPCWGHLPIKAAYYPRFPSGLYQNLMKTGMRPTPVKPEHKIPARGTCQPTREPRGRGHPTSWNGPGSQPHGREDASQQDSTWSRHHRTGTWEPPAPPPGQKTSRQLPGVAVKAGGSHTQDGPPPGSHSPAHACR